jgi:dipeptidyl aminopeptidase/acylaminoacyl peptidase
MPTSSSSVSSRVPLAASLLLLCASVPLAMRAAPVDVPSAAHPPANPRVRAVLEDLGKVQTIRQVALSPDGQHLAWTLEKQIMLAGPHGENPQPLPAGKGCDAGQPQWSPDSRQLVYAGSCGKDTQPDLFLYPLGGHPRQLTHLKGELQSPTWSPDGKRIGFLYVPGATRPAGALAPMKPPAGVIGVEGVEVQRVAAISLEGGEPELLTPARLHVYEFDWAPDSRKLAYIAAAPPGENNWWVAQLYTAAATANAEPASILDPAKVEGPLHGLQIAVPRWSPDATQIAFIGGLMSDQGSTGGDVFLIPAPGGTTRDLTADAAVSSSWLAWTAKDRLVVSQITGGSSRVSSLATSEETRPAETLVQTPASMGDGRLELSLSMAGNNTFAVASSSFEKAPEVYLGQLTPGGKLTQVTHVNDALQPTWGKAESLEWTSDGFRVQGWLLQPRHYDPAKTYPLVVMVHGGPSSAVLPRWPSANFGAPPMSALDYFVLEPNPRGSYGQGERFTAANVKDFGHGDLRDILAGVDAVEKKYPSVDDHRLGLTGWSYGGFMTMFGVTQTQRFHAAVAGAGIANWQSYYGENSIDQWMLPFFGASVYEDPSIYAKSSAIDYIRQVKTPTLVVVGDRDGECPAPQSFEFWHALKAEGVPTELVVYPDEGHAFRKPADRVDVLERTLNWFDQYLR